MMTETRVDVFAIAKDVAVELGDGWSASEGHWSHAQDAYLDGPDGVRLHMAQNHYTSKTHMSISGALGELHHFKPYDASTGDINVSIKKTPKQVAGDITRRLLPVAAPVFAEAQKRKRAHEENEARIAALAEEIRAAMGQDAKVSERDHEVTLGGWNGHTRVSVDPRYGSVKFKIETTPELAVLLAKAIGQL
ncbi:hypothetical protein [Saccharothrix sp. ALI-22-I]|uniref:hypothetical protein n=1 Tax=Saccharothrix sp. ALI-22-I TaxID=1933778 RepID=UPI00117B1ADE|nr:hypothetical protein [Saccharothrix sp. ALI-22-I]